MICGRSKARGMTLAEVLIAGMLGAVLLLCLSAAAGNIFQVYQEGMSEANRSRDAAFSLDVFTKQVRNASNASLTNSRTLVLTDPLAAVTTYAWSGTLGDPLTMDAGTGEVWPLLDGVKDLIFQLHTKDIDAEQDQITNNQLIFFDNYSGYEHWSNISLSPGVQCGIEFTVPASEEIEAIHLTKVDLRLGRKSGQISDLGLFLLESRAKQEPYPSYPYIIAQTVPNGDIPSAVWEDSMWKFYWAEIDLDPGFTIYPNRHYILGMRTLGSYDACMMRQRLLLVSSYWSGWGDWDPPSGPDNGIHYIDSWDNGATWWPDPGTSFMEAIDAPIVLYGDVVKKTTSTQTVVIEVEISVTLDDNGKDRLLFRREQIQGGI